MLYDVLIIGGGITGCMTAYKLAPYQLRVALAEAGSDVANGATRANSAIVHAGYDPEPGTLKAKLNAPACLEMAQICRKLDVEFRKCGTLVAAFSEEELKTLDTLYQQGIENGVPGIEIIGQERLREMEPNISESALAALWAPEAGVVSPYGICIAVAECAAVNGCDFYLDYKVTKIEKKDGIFTVANPDGKTISAKYIVNAAGVHGDEIAALAGEEHFPAKIIPRRGEYMVLDKTAGDIVNRPVFCVPTGQGKGILLTPTVDGNMLVGPNAYKIEDSEEKLTTAEGLAEIAKGVEKIVKRSALNLRSVITQFSGVRPTSAYGDFYIKPSKQIEGLLHLSGIESPGFASSPAVAGMAVELLGEMGLPLQRKEDFADSRPKQIKFMELSDEEKNRLIRENPAYGKIVCRCERITEGEIVDCIHRPVGATTLDMVKRRVRAGMGRCQGGFCSPRVAAILARELGVSLDKITKFGGKSYILTGGERL